jgi:hypothetical protein
MTKEINKQTIITMAANRQGISSEKMVYKPAAMAAIAKFSKIPGNIVANSRV